MTSAVSCQDNKTPCYGLKVGDHVAITILDTYQDSYVPYDSGSPNACGFGFDLEQGQVLVATVAQATPDPVDTCAPLIPQYAPFGGWTWTLLPSSSSSSSSFFGGQYNATNGTCSGGVVVFVTVQPDADPFGPSEAGRVPNVTLRRTFGGSGAPGCPTECIGDFVVSLQKL